MTSPAHSQFLDIKRRHPDEILLFQMGDFYEMFGDDAVVGSEALGITLTSRPFAKGDARVPMAGFPRSALQAHLKRFVQRGLRVAVCNQLTEPGNGLVDRGVVRVVTPGTLVEDSMLDPAQNNYLAAVLPGRDGFGLSYVDVTTGEFAVTELHGLRAAEDLEAEILRLAPAECLTPHLDLPIRAGANITAIDEDCFDADTARDRMCKQFAVHSLEGFGCAHLPLAVGAAGAIISYLERTNPALLGLLDGLRTYELGSFMILDRYTRRSLELTESARSQGPRGSLLWVLDRTKTAMGGRLLRRMLNQPLLEPAPLEQRLNAVTELVEGPVLGSRIKTILGNVADIERLAGRARQGLASARDLVVLRDSLLRVAELSAVLADVQSDELQRVQSQIDPCSDVVDLISRAVAEDGSNTLIKPGFAGELDDLVDSIAGARDWIARLETDERERTGIRSLKVGYNKVFGYYLEISNAHIASVPDEYIRKQTLVNAERYITPELKDSETRILEAEDRIESLSRKLFAGLLQEIATAHSRLAATATSLAYLDVYRALAELASQQHYVRPELDTSDRLEIEGGRHPVVEITMNAQSFVPNDVLLDRAEHQIIVLTGPNMGGKSTYLRQVALIVLMAQIGSFVPAARARIGLVDRIFSRVGAQDDIAGGQSTFMVEMVETANILRHATARSLVVLDEIGRGTSTYDGLAIARAVTEHLHDHLGARTLFATHYHEMTALADRLSRVDNASVAVAEEGKEVVFLHRVVPGGADRSYGIHVARLAGLPGSVTDRAQEVMIELEAKDEADGRRPSKRKLQQNSLFDSGAQDRALRLVEELLHLDVSSMTPLEAISQLFELQEKSREG